jgi:hypothetical protein
MIYSVSGERRDPAKVPGPGLTAFFSVEKPQKVKSFALYLVDNSIFYSFYYSLPGLAVP